MPVAEKEPVASQKMASTPAPSPAAPSDPVPSVDLAAVSGPDIFPSRLSDIRADISKEQDGRSLNLSLDEGVAVTGAGSAEVREGVLNIAAGERQTLLQWAVDLDAHAYSEFRVRMRVEDGAECMVAWRQGKGGTRAIRNGPTARIYPDGAFHEYRIPLTDSGADGWVGRIGEIALWPSNRVSAIEVAEAQLVYVAPESPPRMTMSGTSQNALYGSQPPWSLKVPPDGRLDFHVTPDSVLGGPSANRVNGQLLYSVRMETESQGEVVLFESQRLPGAVGTSRPWTRVQKDLSAFAGETVSLRMDIVGEDSKAFPLPWGNPMVYQASIAEEATPVVLISLDTTRADHLSCYGYERETTPYLDAWAEKEAVLFERAIVHETWTLPSHASMLTGLYPKTHGANADVNFSESVTTLAERLKEARYLTAGFTGYQHWLAGWRGFARGFDVYSVPKGAVRDIFETYALLKDWTDNHAVSNLFLFFHAFDAHDRYPTESGALPYGPLDPNYHHFLKEFDPPPSFETELKMLPPDQDIFIAANVGLIELSEEQLAYCIAGYDDSLRMMDSALNEFFSMLKGHGIYDQALIIITADHGEEFIEHGMHGHNQVYDESAHVPLIMKLPHGEHGGTRVKSTVQTVDIVPTVLDVVGLPITPELEGQSLLRVVEETETPRNVAHVRRRQQEAIYDGAWKYIRHGRMGLKELYNVDEDPTEVNNRVDEVPAPPVLESAREKIDAFYAFPSEGWHVALVMMEGRWPATLELEVPRKIDSAMLIRSTFAISDVSKDEQVIRQTKNTFSVNVEDLTVGWDMVNLRSVDSNDPLGIHVKSDTSFRLIIGDSEPRIMTAFQEIVPTTAAIRPEALDDPSVLRDEVPTVVVWYEEPAMKREAARDLTEEEISDLKALGYLE
jgi:arylsulfatase A-like enzyme